MDWIAVIAMREDVGVIGLVLIVLWGIYGSEVE